MGSKAKYKNIPKKQQGKPKKWKRGHSAISNPQSSRFREAAKGRFFAQNTGPSMLTVDALQKHDNDQDGQSMNLDSDQQTLGTFKTWASNWTECTNATFSKVHKFSNSASHKEILAILAAVTEVIKAEGGTESETEYFAALMTTLETTDGTDSQTAIMYLITLVIKKLPVAILRNIFSQIAKVFLDLLAKHTDEAQASLLRSLLMSLAYLLRSQEQAVWNNTSVQQVYKGLLTFITHKKPKVRKAAHAGVCIILKGSLFMIEDNPPPYHPAAAMTTKFCVQIIEECGGTGEAKDTLHILNLFQSILSVLPKNSLKSACETVLRVMTLSNVFVKASGMQSLHAMFAANPKGGTLSSELNAQIITALYDYQPGENDVQPTQAWLAVMEMAHINLSSLDKKLCLNHLPKLFSAGMVCLLSAKTEITGAACKLLKSLLLNCVAPVAEEVKSSVQSASNTNPSPIHKIVKALESGLSYQFHVSWGLVLQIFAAAYPALGKHYPQLLSKSLKTIADLRESVRFEFKGELDVTVGCAIKAMGPQKVLNAVPLQITGQCDDLDFPRSWLIPVMRDNIAETELGFFTSYFLPLAAKLRQRAMELSDQQNMVASKTYDILQYQIWSLLPGFCTRPTDIGKSFKGIAKVLGTAISDRTDLRLEVMSSVRKLISQSLSSDEMREEISKFSKNFLPILFNLYTTDEVDQTKDNSRLAVFETIKCYFQITDKQLMSTYCEKCQEKMKDANTTAPRKHALHDLFIAMIPYLQSKHLEQMYTLALEHLQDTDKTLQKKCYRILEDICAGNSPESRAIVLEKLPSIQETLLQSLSASAPSSKAPRLRCVTNVFKLLDSEHNEFLLATVPEAILCTKEVGERARMASYSLLVEMGNAVIRWSDDDEDALGEYFKMVMAGFAGSPQMISATLFSLTRIMFEFKDKVSDGLLQSIIENSCVLLKSKSREVVQSALSFIKVLIRAYPVTVLSQYLKDIMKSLVSMKEDCHHHFRFKAKEIYGKLIKKFGYETIYGMTPEGLKKVLANIRKTTDRAKRKNELDEEADSDEDSPVFKSRTESIEDILQGSDSELEADDDDKKKKKAKSETKEAKSTKKSGKSWLLEGGEDEIMDFMDMKASQKVTATKPVEKVTKKTDSGFKMTPDGRLIITEQKEYDGKSDDSDDIDDLLEQLENRRDGKIKQKTKRKIDELGDSDEDKPSATKYKAGGKGIHRPLGKKLQKTTDYGSEYRAKKAKGDMKKAGKPDPYAYVPLDFRQLNKRKQAKLTGRFKNLVKGAQRGADKGKKNKKTR